MSIISYKRLGLLLRIEIYSYTNEDILASGSCDTTIKLWNTTTMKLIMTLTGHTDCINALLSYTYLGSNYLISGSSDTDVKIWNHQASNQSLFDLKIEQSKSIKALAYNKIYDYLAIGSKEGTFSLWRKTSEYEGINIQTLHLKNCSVSLFAIIPNSLKIVRYSSSCSNHINCNSTIEICQLESPYKCITNLAGHNDSIDALTILPNSSNIVSGSHDGTIKICQLESPFKCIVNLIGHTHSVTSLVISPNSKNIISASADKTIRIWRSESPYDCITTLHGHTQWIRALVILPNSNIVSGGSMEILKYGNQNHHMNV